jgi:hypothetical protein
MLQIWNITLVSKIKGNPYKYVRTSSLEVQCQPRMFGMDGVYFASKAQILGRGGDSQ